MIAVNRVVSRDENVYTMAANAALRLIVDNQIDPRAVGFFGLGTESSTDNAMLASSPERMSLWGCVVIVPASARSSGALTQG